MNGQRDALNTEGRDDALVLLAGAIESLREVQSVKEDGLADLYRLAHLTDALRAITAARSALLLFALENATRLPRPTQQALLAEARKDAYARMHREREQAEGRAVVDEFLVALLLHGVDIDFELERMVAGL